MKSAHQPQMDSRSQTTFAELAPALWCTVYRIEPRSCHAPLGNSPKRTAQAVAPAGRRVLFDRAARVGFSRSAPRGACVPNAQSGAGARAAARSRRVRQTPVHVLGFAGAARALRRPCPRLVVPVPCGGGARCRGSKEALARNRRSMPRAGFAANEGAAAREAAFRIEPRAPRLLLPARRSRGPARAAGRPRRARGTPVHVHRGFAGAARALRRRRRPHFARPVPCGGYARSLRVRQETPACELHRCEQGPGARFCAQHWRPLEAVFGTLRRGDRALPPTRPGLLKREAGFVFSKGYGNSGGDKPADSNGLLDLPSEVVRDAEISTWAAAKTRRLGCERRQRRAGGRAERAGGPEARAARRPRPARQTPAHVQGGFGHAPHTLLCRPRARVHPARRKCGARALASLPTKAAPPMKRRLGSSLARRLLPVSAARAYAPSAPSGPSPRGQAVTVRPPGSGAPCEADPGCAVRGLPPPARLAGPAQGRCRRTLLRLRKWRWHGTSAALRLRPQ
jgi:hypothetical protein